MTDEKPRFTLIEHKREVVTYAELWHASKVVLERGLADPKGATWQFLSSVILAAFALEAYLNHVGDIEIANWSDLERPLSPEAKLRHVALTLRVDLGAKGERPLSTIGELIRVRNVLAHGRSETLEPEPKLHPLTSDIDRLLADPPLTRWEQAVRDENFPKRVHEDLELVFKMLHGARSDPKDQLFSFGYHSSGTRTS